MLIEQTISEPDGLGGRVKTHRMRFDSQAEEVIFLSNMIATYRHMNSIRQLAIWIVFDWGGCPPKAPLLHALTIGRWVQSGARDGQGIRYVNEGDEMFQTPVQTLRIGAGDCDDFDTLEGTLCEAIGIPVESVAMEVRPEAPDIFKQWFQNFFRTPSLTHIFPRALCRTSRGKFVRLPLDATLRQAVGTVNPITMAVRRGNYVRTFIGPSSVGYR